MYKPVSAFPVHHADNRFFGAQNELIGRRRSHDILDEEGDSQQMGKPVGGDAAKGKNTYPAVFGLARSKEIQNGLVEMALESLKPFDHRADPLRQIAGYIIERKK